MLKLPFIFPALLLATLSSLAHADNLGNRRDSIEIGVNDQLNCNHIEKGTRVFSAIPTSAAARSKIAGTVSATW